MIRHNSALSNRLNITGIRSYRPGRLPHPNRPHPWPRRSVRSLRHYLIGKRCFDIILSLIIALPVALMVLICVGLVRLTSRGPGLYSQRRVGQFGQVFTIVKIRSMVHECELTSGPKWCVPGDPRVTPLGRILRTLHLDELPQLWNVLKGEMSLVGPRPERPEIADKLRRKIAGYDRRVMVLPGITGLAQITLPPDLSIESVDKKLHYDMAYINRMSWRLELAILFRTGLKVIGIRLPI